MVEKATKLKNIKKTVYMKDLDNLQLLNDTLESIGLDVNKISLIDMQEVLDTFENFIVSAMNLKEKKGL